jgi:hypothetical protein
VGERTHRSRGERYKLGKSGDGIIHNDPLTHSRPRGFSQNNRHQSSLSSGGHMDGTRGEVLPSQHDRYGYLKVKTHRGEPLNEEVDDLTETGQVVHDMNTGQ